MRRCFVVSLSCVSVFAALASVPAAAAARTVHHHARVHVVHYSAPPLTVRRRSFLDPGNVVPVGSQSRYMDDSTVFFRTTDQTYARGKFGNETLPWPLELTGRQEPVFVFSTGGW